MGGGGGREGVAVNAKYRVLQILSGKSVSLEGVSIHCCL